MIVALSMMSGLLPSPLATLVVSPTSSIPADGQTYASLTEVYIETPTPWSEERGEVNLVYFMLDGSYQGTQLYLVEETNTLKTWKRSIESPSVGTHTFRFQAGPGYELVSGTFTISPKEFNGEWWVGSQQVVSSSQVITVHTNNPLFKFVKTSSGPDDSEITCTATWSGDASGTKTLDYKGDGVWQNNIRFDAGTYTIDLVATDGATINQLSINATWDDGNEEDGDDEGTLTTTTTPTTTTPATQSTFDLLSLSFLLVGVALISVGGYWEWEYEPES